MNEQPWLEIAKGELGVHETPGPEATARIVEYDQTTTLKATSDEVPWCSSFVNWCLAQVEVEGTNSAAAISWAEWGQETDSPMPGDITVFQWASGGHHVAFFVSYNAETDVVQVLGGNQHDKVCYANFSWNNVINTRTLA